MTKNFQKVIMKSERCVQSQDFKQERLDLKSSELKKRNDTKLNQFKMACSDLRMRIQAKNSAISKKHQV